VATVAVGAVVDVVPNAAVMTVRLSLGMATSGAAEDGVVGCVGVTVRASVPNSPPVGSGGDREPSVVERGTGPLSGVVTSFTSLGESGGSVVRVRCCVIDGAMAAIAVFGRALEDTVHVATGACRSGVLSGERKCRGAVIEGRTGPLRGVVARFAGLWESGAHVVRIGGVLELRKVTRDARRRQSSVLVVHVTSRAGNRCMSAGQREACGAVVKRGAGPLRRVVAQRAVLRETGGYVIRIRGALILEQVTGGTRGAESGEPSIHMAGRTGGRCVFAG